MSETIEEDKIEEKFNTICKVCIFANRDKSGNQTGCSLNVLEKLEAQGIKLSTVSDDGPLYTKIHGAICQWARVPEWNGAANPHKEELAREEIRDKSRLDVVVDFDHEHNISNLATTLTSIKEQEVKPYQVIVTTNNLTPRFVVSLVNFVRKEMDGSGIAWRVERGLEEQEKNARVGRAMRKCKKMYFAFFDAGAQVPKSFFKDIDVYLNEKMGRFSLILPIDPDSDNGTVIQTGLYATLGAPEQFVGILQSMAKEQSSKHMIKNPKEVFSWMK